MVMGMVSDEIAFEFWPLGPMPHGWDEFIWINAFCAGIGALGHLCDIT